ncbi:MAG: hypothetical protein ACHREM_27140, partial [Polyangiales bacterium]
MVVEDRASAIEWATSPAILLAIVALGFAMSLAGKRRWTLRLWLFAARTIEIGVVVLTAWAIAPVPTKVLHWAWRIGPWTICAIATVAVFGVWIAWSGVRKQRRVSTLKRGQREAMGYREDAAPVMKRATAKATSWTLRFVRMGMSRGAWGTGRLMCAMGVAWLAVFGLVGTRAILVNWVPSSLRTTQDLVGLLAKQYGNRVLLWSPGNAPSTLRTRGDTACPDLRVALAAATKPSCEVSSSYERPLELVELA